MSTPIKYNKTTPLTASKHFSVLFFCAHEYENQHQVGIKNLESNVRNKHKKRSFMRAETPNILFKVQI